jgi:hypothetical protein
VDGRTQQGPYPDVDSGEAINGVAFTDGLIAASTRSEVYFREVSRLGENDALSTVFNGGAHGIVATRAGRFIAPIGPRGILVLEPKRGDRQKMRIIEATGKTLYFYRIATVGTLGGGDVLVCALRRDGVALLVLSQAGETSSMSKITFTGLDVVDVCSLGAEESPLAAAALGFDRSIHLFRDIQSDRPPLSLRFDDLQGCAYRILSAQGHIFVLTSRGIYALKGLASRLIGGDRVDGPTTIRSRDLQAVDVNLAFDQWLLIVMPDHVLSIPIDRLVAPDEATSTSAVPTGGSNGIFRPTVMEPTWESHPGFELAETV